MQVNSRVLLIKLVASVLLTLSFFELVSIFTFFSLSFSSNPYPWSVFTVIQHGVFFEPILSLIAVLIPILLLAAYAKGGFTRVIAYYLNAAIEAVLISVSFGLLAFTYLEDIVDLSWFDVLSLAKSIHQDGIVYDHFWYSQGISFAFIVVLGGWFIFDKYKSSNNVLGSAHFANGLEVQKAKFFTSEPESIIIGKKYGVPLYANGFEHVLVFAPSGSGKTRSIAIPNLLNYPYSIVCNDVKFTLFDTTSGFRQTKLGNACFCFAPSRQTGVTHRYNPLDFISSDKQHRMTDIQRMAHIFIPDNPKDPIWGQTCRQLFKALVLYLLDSPDRKITFGEISRLVKQDQFDWWLKQELDETDHYDAEFYRNGYSYINTPDKTRGNVLISFIGHFELFDDPIIDAATSGSDFDLRDIRRKKMTIYVGFTDEDMERLSPLLTLFWQQLISFMIKEIPDIKQEPYPVLCLIDEFSSLGRLERLRRSLKLLREYRVRCILMFQYIAQTYEKYSHDEAKAFTNIKTKVAYTTEDLNDAEFISKMLGTRTKRVVTHSVSSQQNGNSNSKNVSYQAIPLLRPDELMKLPSYVSLIMRSGSAPIKAGQWIWYREPSMKKLPCSPSTVPMQTIVHYPFVRTLFTEKTCEEEVAYMEG